MRSKRLWSIIFSLLAAGLWSQTVDETVAIGDRFMQMHNYRSAYKYYLRAAFFAPAGQVGTLYGKLGDASLGAGLYREAVEHYNRAASIEKDDSLRTEWQLKKVTALALDKRYKLALLELLNYSGPFTPGQLKARAYLKGLAYYGLEEFDRAREALLQTLPPSDTLRRHQLETLFTKKNLYRPNPVTAMWLSRFVPGLGQLYAGDWKNAADSFILNGLLGYLLLRDAYRYSLIDSFMGIFPWLERYYTGGYNNARKIALQKRREKRGRIFRKAYQIIYP